MGRIEIIIGKEGAEFKAAVTPLQLLAGVSMIINAAKQSGAPDDVIKCAVQMGLDDKEFKTSVGTKIPLEKIADDTSISKEFADILRGMTNE